MRKKLEENCLELRQSKDAGLYIHDFDLLTESFIFDVL